MNFRLNLNLNLEVDLNQSCGGAPKAPFPRSTCCTWRCYIFHNNQQQSVLAPLSPKNAKLLMPWKYCNCCDLNAHTIQASNTLLTHRYFQLFCHFRFSYSYWSNTVTTHTMGLLGHCRVCHLTRAFLVLLTFSYSVHLKRTLANAQQADVIPVSK